MAAITEVVKRRPDGSGRSINEEATPSPTPLPSARPLVHVVPSSARTPLMPPISFTVNGKRETVNRSEEHTSELQSQSNLVCRLLLEKKKNPQRDHYLTDLIYTSRPCCLGAHRDGARRTE